MRVRRSVARGVIGAIVALLCGLVPGVARAGDEVRIVSATIEERGPIDPAKVAEREVVFRVELAGTPPCGRGASSSVGFVIDADRNRQTSVGSTRRVRARGRRRMRSSTSPFADIGVDARVVARCNPRTGRFESPLGPASVVPAMGGEPATIEIVTVIGLLPSVDFDWVAYATDGRRSYRLPAANHRVPPRGHGRFRVLELSKN